MEDLSVHKFNLEKRVLLCSHFNTFFIHIKTEKNKNITSFYIKIRLAKD